MRMLVLAAVLSALALAGPASAQFSTLGVGGFATSGGGPACGNISLDFSDVTGCNATLYFGVLK